MGAYLLAVLIALDQLANAMLRGAPDETLSARAWRAERRGRPAGRLRPVIDCMFLVLTAGRDKDHCRKAYESEVQRRQFPSHYNIYS